ncbi:hypothetical protein [Pantoea sp. CCBC3-3-1]|uniref:hypothetical protein n=1 Tax=Pantoea sp. CCBC3-3-1 TaxID=2490851 RepID=UPI0011BED480|nr:hypothetical protein [Pantoea sp. CCBC3-3-1]
MSAQPAAVAEDSVAILEAINEGFNTQIGQLNYAIKRVAGDDMSVRHIENCINGLQTLAMELAGIASNDIDDHDHLIGLLGDRDTSVRLLTVSVENLNEQLAILRGRAETQSQDMDEAIERATHEAQLHMAELRAMVDNLTNTLDEKKALIETYMARDKNQRVEIRELNILEPHKLKKKNQELKTEARDNRAKITMLSQTIFQRDKELTKAKSDSAHLMAGLEAERGEVARLADHIKRANTISAGYKYETVMTNGQPLHFVINRTFRGTFTLQADGIYPRYVNNLDFTFIIWASIGVGAAVSLNEWLRPNYRRDPLITEYWPQDLYDALQDMYREEIQNTHPHLLKRVAWAESVALESIGGLTAAQKKALSAEGHDTLCSIVMFDASELAMTKGISAKSAEQILTACYVLVDAWDRENGAPVIAYEKEPK